jgi:hypothetical protein
MTPSSVRFTVNQRWLWFAGISSIKGATKPSGSSKLNGPEILDDQSFEMPGAIAATPC